MTEEDKAAPDAEYCRHSANISGEASKPNVSACLQEGDEKAPCAAHWLKHRGRPSGRFPLTQIESESVMILIVVTLGIDFPIKGLFHS